MNFVFILCDDLGYGDMGCFGGPHIDTPNLDRLAAEGLRFTDHYSGSPVCGPARCVLMQGLHTGHCTRRRNRMAGQPLVPLNADDHTITRMLGDAGYTVGVFGKWALGNPGTDGAPWAHGVDEFVGFCDQVAAHDHYPGAIMRNQDFIDIKGNQTQDRQVYINDRFCDEAVSFIERHHDRPFFCYFPTTLPHAPNDCPELGRYADEDWPEPAKHRAAMISRIDSYVGRVRQALEDAGVAENTLVVFSSDHGPDTDSTYLDAHGPLRGRKRDMHEAGHRVPTIAWAPGLIKPADTDALTAFYDWMPTFADLAGVACPPTDGLSLVPLLRGERRVEHEFYYAEGYGHQVVRRDNFKFMRPIDHPEAPEELYDLSTDIGEQHNLAEAQADLVAELGAIMDQEHVASADFPLGFREQTDPAVYAK